MAKKLKKNKPAASNQKKPAPAKAGGIGAVLKKAAKSVAKKVTAPLPKKVAAKAKKPTPTPASVAVKSSAKAKHDTKSAKKVVVATKVSVTKISVMKVTALIAAKGSKAEKKSAAPAATVISEKSKTKSGKKEVVVELPAAKGLVILDKSEKRAAKKLANEAALNKKRCREPGCDHDCTIVGYCRMHYIKNWRKIKRKEAILASGQLNNYVEELVSKYPDKYLDVIRQDLASEKDWSKVVVDLELESADEDASAEEDIDVAAEGVSRTRTEFDDDSDAF